MSTVHLLLSFRDQDDREEENERKRLINGRVHNYRSLEHFTPRSC